MTWVISPIPERTELGPSGSGEVSFPVTNEGPVADDAVFEAVPGEGAVKTWFTVPSPQKRVDAGTSVEFVLTVEIPPGSPAGTYWLQGRVYSANTAPEESSTLSNRVTFEVKPTPPKPKPWWLLAVAGLVIVVAAVAAFLLLRSDEVTMPDLAAGKTTPAQAKKDLEARGLKVGTVRYRHQPSEAGTVVRQSVSPNTEVSPGTRVDLIVAVTLAAPALESPASGTTIGVADNVPALTWQKVEYAASYQVDVRKESCTFRLVVRGSAETRCDFGGPAPQTTKETSFTPALTFNGGINDRLILRLFNDTGRVQWRVTAVDAFGNSGPSSEFITFKKLLK
ncbi:PASTA domain-containing protein [Actinopolymorpha alba]|uniref:PASTA domain-containing protein n=1 Tax=Actinopolymorpha alba TaxID=533267 RepID=UPI0003A4D843|nr:PASTA domain-containing protein [Actinopolymorpha alba]